MKRPQPISNTLVALLLLSFPVLPGQRKKNEEPKSQVLPLPPEPPRAIAATTSALDFHISPLLRTGGLSAQIRQSLNDLIRETRGETILKLRAFVAGAGDARRVEQEATAIFTEHRLPLPVLSILQVGALPQESAAVVIEAVVSTRRNENPNGLAFFNGQVGMSLDAALARLKKSVMSAGVSPDRVVSCTCFTSRIEDPVGVRSAIQTSFSNTAINVVQAVRDPLNDISNCEAVAQLALPPKAPVVWLKNSRVTLVNSPRLIFTGLQLSFGDYLDDAHEAFARLARDAATAGSPGVAVQMNAFALDPYAGSALRKTASAPPNIFTLQSVEGLTAIDASGGVEAVFAPDISTPVTLPR